MSNFNWSRSNGLDTKDLFKHIVLEDDMELAAEDCKPILLVSPDVDDHTLTLNIELGQGMLIINLSDEANFKVMDKKEIVAAVTVNANAVLGAILLTDSEGVYYLETNN